MIVLKIELTQLWREILFTKCIRRIIRKARKHVHKTSPSLNVFTLKTNLFICWYSTQSNKFPRKWANMLVEYYFERNICNQTNWIKIDGLTVNFVNWHFSIPCELSLWREKVWNWNEITHVVFVCSFCLCPCVSALKKTKIAEKTTPCKAKTDFHLIHLFKNDKGYIWFPKML